MAVHPPAFNARDEHSLTVACSDSAHTQLRFFLDKPGAANLLELTVSGEDEPRVLPVTTHDTNRRWLEQIVDVEPGAHTYTFRAWSENDSEPGIVIDSISCLTGKPKEAVNGEVDLDDGFIPVEIMGDWQVDNMLGVQGGDVAAHPPALKVGDERSLTVTCSDPSHAQLRFFLDKPGAANLLELTVSGEDAPRPLPVTTHDTNRRWLEQIVDVAPGAHTYTLRAWLETDTPSSIVVDSFSCR